MSSNRRRPHEGWLMAVIAAVVGLIWAAFRISSWLNDEEEDEE